MAQGKSFSVHPAKKWNITFVLVSSSISDQKDPRDRMVQVVKWYLSAFHAGRRGSVAKKPYNPILGEIFQCHWTLPNDTEENAVSPRQPRSVCRCLCVYLCDCGRVCVSNMCAQRTTLRRQFCVGHGSGLGSSDLAPDAFTSWAFWCYDFQLFHTVK